jgi:hypothetical protein
MAVTGLAIGLVMPRSSSDSNSLHRQRLSDPYADLSKIRWSTLALLLIIFGCYHATAMVCRAPRAIAHFVRRGSNAAQSRFSAVDRAI